jgi:hypothetical protein
MSDPSMPTKKENITTILEDYREIDEVYFPDSESRLKVGSCGVKAIRAYAENGEHCHIPWIAVIGEDGQITGRYNIGYIDSIFYKK